MSKTKWYAKPIYLLVALALVLSLGIVAVPMAGTVEANSITWTEYLGNPVFDGINRAYYPRVLAIDGTYHMWYTDTDSAGNYQVGYTTSADGISWETADMVTGLTGTPNHVVVVNVGTEASPHYRIWYANAAVWPYNVDLLRTAESEDGLAWTNDQPIVQANNLIREDNSSDPAYQWVYGSYGPGAVLYNPDGYESLDEEDPMGNKYVMYYDQYTRYGSTGVNEVTMLAISTDGINWKRYGNTPVLNATGGSTAWDAQYAYAWTVLELSDGYHMWYSGGTKDSNDGIGYAYSADGLTWTKEPNPVLHVNDVGAPEWRQERSYTPCVIKEGTTYKMWFAGKGSGYSIGYATGSAPPSEVWVDDDWAGLSPGDPADGHIFGYDAFATIQDGIDAVAGSTVNVAAGTYDSSSGTFPIVIDKSLTLLGAQANVDPRPSEAGRTGDESIIDADETSSAVIQISASDVEINGFTITGGTGDMVEESSSADNLLFRYNILYDDLATCNPGDEAIQIKNSDGVVMEYNYAYNICEDAFNLSDSTNGAIRYNEAHDIYSENAAIYCYGSTGLEIRGNLIYDVPNNDGIKLGDKNGADASKTGGLIKDNIVHDTRQDGISVYMSGVTVEGNEVYNSSSENGAIYLAFAISDIIIRNNSVHDNGLSTSKRLTAAGILLEGRVDAAGVTVNCNKIYNNNPYGVTNEATGLLDAEYNWWGSANGPEDPAATEEEDTEVPSCTDDPASEKNTVPAAQLGDKVSDDYTHVVDYCPWLVEMEEFIVDHAKLDFKKKADDDKVRVQGKLELGANSNGVEISEDVTVTVGPLSEIITMVEKGKKDEKWEYKRPKGGEGDIKDMTIDWKSGKFDIRMDKADLTGVSNPVTISIQIGDDLGSASILMTEKKHHWDYKAK